VPEDNRFSVAVVTHIWVQQGDKGGLEQLVAVEGCDHNKGGGDMWKITYVTYGVC
jgi:hypothetical protein